MPTKKPLVILDRDGVLIHNNLSMKNGPYYVTDPEQAIVKEGVEEGIDMLFDIGAVFVIVTKQNCVRSGLATALNVRHVNAVLKQRVLGLAGATTRVYWGAEVDGSARAAIISSVLYDMMVFVKDGLVDQETCPVWVIDDSLEGIQAAQSLGCRTIWIENPHGVHVANIREQVKVVHADWTVTNFLDAATLIVKSIKGEWE